MTDRLLGLTVTFDQDIREDDAQALIGAIKLLRHVIAVEPVVSEGWRDAMLVNRAAAEIRRALYDTLEAPELAKIAEGMRKFL